MIKIKLLFICSFLFFLSSKLAIGMHINNTTIVAGTAKITGRISTPEGINKDSIFVTITVIANNSSLRQFDYRIDLDVNWEFAK